MLEPACSSSGQPFGLHATVLFRLVAMWFSVGRRGGNHTWGLWKQCARFRSPTLPGNVLTYPSQRCGAPWATDIVRCASSVPYVVTSGNVGFEPKAPHNRQEWVLAAVLLTQVGIGIGGGVAFCAGGDAEETKEATTSEINAAKIQKIGKRLLSQYRMSTELKITDVNEIIMDPSNREGDGVNIEEVLNKARSIEAQGFDPERVRVVLVQMPLDATGRQDIFDKNKEWKSRDERYPSWDEGRVQYTCVGGNHLVTFLKMVTQTIPCASFCSMTGPAGDEAISIDMLRSTDGDFANAVTEGVPCITLLRSVREVPNALLDIQAAENAGATLYTPESDKQCVLRCAKVLSQPDVSMTWEQRLTILQGQFPHLRDHIADFCYFVDRMGGSESHHFKHWKLADSRFTSNRAMLSGKFMRSVAALSVQVPYVKRGLGWVAKQLPRGYTWGGSFPDWLTTSDVANLKGPDKRDMVNEAEAFLKLTEEESFAVSSESDRLLLLCRTEARVIRYLTSKKHESFPLFETLDDLKTEWAIEMAQYKKDKKTAPRSAKEAMYVCTMYVDYVCVYV